ncbi:MAG: hypothetical protein U1F43_12475 [Myxococcota bacterium]
MSSNGLLSVMTLAFLGPVLGAACGSDTTNSGKSCEKDDDCPTATICDNGLCTAHACDGNADCLNGDQSCIETSGGGMCSAVECGCANCSACPVGEQCDNGSCVQATACSAANPCTGTDVCDAGTCRACAGNECPSDCTVSGCPQGKTCNTTSKLCESSNPTVDPCATCGSQSDCPSDWKCVPLASGQHCLPPCSSNNDCETGFECQNAICAPSGGRCEGCLVNGCGTGQACNANTHVCGAAVAECGTCAADWECGLGSACKNGECRTRCDGSTCAGGGACTATTSQIQVCQDMCAAECTPACSGSTPICDAGTCVECKTSNDCDGGQSCDGSGHCTGTLSCQAPTPVEWQGTCVECTSNNDCNGKFCDITNHVCTDSQCASCAAPYPACVTIGTDSYCVQCAIDDDCGVNGHCNTSTYACEGGTVTPTDKCTKDEDCDSGASTGFTLQCDVPTGLCYDVNGSCDDVTAFCINTSGQQTKCSSLFDLFGGAGGGGLPPELSGGGTIPGNCGCTCGPLGCIDAGDCRVGSCVDFAGLLALLGGGTPTSSAPICFDLGGLTGP